MSQKIIDSIPEPLVYSCLYWTTHFTEANREAAEALVSEFFQCLKVVYWVEALSLVGGLMNGLDSLQSVRVFFKVCLGNMCY